MGGPADTGNFSRTRVGNLLFPGLCWPFVVRNSVLLRLIQIEIDFRFLLPNRFGLVNAGLLYVYFSSFQAIDEEEFGGAWELTKEGFMTSSAGFLVMWTIIYSGLHH